ncbi:MAG: pitrilysin family protein [Candidatus Peregrinibacteria bacterium]|nr:pitrilysin family protein [Candidatus Peregrinibacteria bacterium]MDZ4245267.1 pitrilysin family protein [Candidatus Gracilibacteria bacterium]
MLNKTTLENGLRIVTKKLEGTNAVTVLIFVAAGSRFETKENNGIAHFLEHMFFKGGVRYKNTKEVSGTIDGIGGDFNAFTGKEYVGYYVKVAKEKMDTAIDVLSDMMMNATFDPTEIDKERGVILEELNMYQDTPMYQVGWNFEQLLFGDQPLGWDQIGTKELIRTVMQDDFRKYQKDLYTPENVVITVAGNVEHDEIVAKIKAMFPFADGKRAYDSLPIESLESPEKVHVVNKKTEQAHIVCGFEAYDNDHKDKFAEKLLAVILGGNMSSRMFLNVREQKGLSYYIQTSTDFYKDTGAISTRAGVDINRIKLAVEAIIEEYKNITLEDVPEIELQKAKDYLKGKMTLKLEDTEEYAYFVTEQELLKNEIKTLEEIFAEVDKVTVADIRRVSMDLFKEEKLRLALIGPCENPKEYEDALKF